MARLTANFFSDSLRRKVDINAIIPIENDFSGKFKTLYLLNGIMGDRSDWEEGTSVVELSKKYNTAVVTISGENKFYVDNPKSCDFFGKYVGEEIVDVTRKLFNLSDKREDTFIGGLSMGGYGAVINGLKHSETFSKIAVMSAAFIVDMVLASENKENPSLSSRGFFESIFGDLTKLKGGENDYCAQIDNHIKDGRKIPDIYMTIGKNDFVFNTDEKFHEFLVSRNVEHKYVVDEGEHDWDYWFNHIESLFEFCNQ